MTMAKYLILLDFCTMAGNNITHLSLLGNNVTQLVSQSRLSVEYSLKRNQEERSSEYWDLIDISWFDNS